MMHNTTMTLSRYDPYTERCQTRLQGSDDQRQLKRNEHETPMDFTNDVNAMFLNFAAYYYYSKQNAKIGSAAVSRFRVDDFNDRTVTCSHEILGLSSSSPNMPAWMWRFTVLEETRKIVKTAMYWEKPVRGEQSIRNIQQQLTIYSTIVMKCVCSVGQIPPKLWPTNLTKIG